MYPIKDCNCEDFPCCEHADNYPSEPEYCDMCGFAHRSIDCPTGYEEDVDDEDEDEIDLTPYQKIMDDINANDIELR